jgi:hypothetical protein
MTSRTTRRGSTARRRPPRTVTINFGPPHGSTRHGRRHGLTWLLWRLVRWTAIWTGRATAWGGRQAVRRTAGHVTRTRRTWADWTDRRAEHGLRTPLVQDMFTREWHPADAVAADTPTGGDPQIRDRQDEDAQAVRDRLRRQDIERMMRQRVRPPWWERWMVGNGWRDEDTVWEPYRESIRARRAVLARYLAGQPVYRGPVREPAPMFAQPPTPQPAPVPNPFSGLDRGNPPPQPQQWGDGQPIFGVPTFTP